MKEAFGELVDTFLLVFFGCASVAAAVLTEAHLDLFEVAVIWGIGVALGITVSAPFSQAHLNPAVTIALAAWKGFAKKRVPVYLAMQVLGAIAAAAIVYAINADALQRFESRQGLVRGANGSGAAVMTFSDFFPNPAGRPLAAPPAPLSMELRSCFAEGVGTAVLLLVVCSVREDEQLRTARPWILGTTITALICLIAPLTMAGLNPVRDLGPRLFSLLAGWGTLSFRSHGWGWLTVYILSPIAGGWAGAGLHSVMRRLPDGTEKKV